MRTTGFKPAWSESINTRTSVLGGIISSKRWILPQQHPCPKSLHMESHTLSGHGENGWMCVAWWVYYMNKDIKDIDWYPHKIKILRLFICHLNTLNPRQNGHHFPYVIFRCIFLNENIWIAINISLSFVPKGPIDNIPSLVPIMAWRRSGDKPLSEPMMVSLPTHMCVTRPHWVN